MVGFFDVDGSPGSVKRLYMRSTMQIGAGCSYCFEDATID